MLPEGFGFLRAPDYNYLPGPDDIYVSPSQIRKFDLRTAGHRFGADPPPKEGERYFALIQGGGGQLRTPGRGKDKIFFRQTDPALPPMNS